MSAFLFGLLATLGSLSAVILAPVLLVTLVFGLFCLGSFIMGIVRRIKAMLGL